MSASSGTAIAARGRMVRRTAVRDELDRGLDSMEREVRQLTQVLRDDREPGRLEHQYGTSVQ